MRLPGSDGDPKTSSAWEMTFTAGLVHCAEKQKQPSREPLSRHSYSGAEQLPSQGQFPVTHPQKLEKASHVPPDEQAPSHAGQEPVQLPWSKQRHWFTSATQFCPAGQRPPHVG